MLLAARFLRFVNVATDILALLTALLSCLDA